MQMTCKGSDQTARKRRLIRGFAGRTYHIVGNLMLRLKYSQLLFNQILMPWVNVQNFQNPEL